MLDYISHWDISGKSRPLIDWKHMLHIIDTRLSIYDTRLLGQTSSENWVNFFNAILALVPYHILLNEPENKKYADTLLDVVSNIDFILMPRYVLKPKYNFIFSAHNKQQIQEYLIPCKNSTSLMDLPLDRPLSEWEHIQPIRVLFHNSTELYGRMILPRFEYKESPPSVVIETIDTTALVLKYLAYVEDCHKQKIAVDRRRFIVSHVFRHMCYDVLRCWLFNLVNEGIDNSTHDIIVDSDLASGAVVAKAMRDLNEYIIALKTRTYSVGDFLQEKWFPPNLSSMVDYIRFFATKINIPPVAQAEYIRMLLEINILSIIIKANNFRHDRASLSRNYQLGHKLKLFKMKDVLRYCPDTGLRAKLNSKLDELIFICSNDGLEFDDTQSAQLED